MAISQADFERLLKTKRKVKVTAVQLSVTMGELKDETAAIVLRGAWEDSVYRMYLGGAIKGIEAPVDEATMMEMAAFVLGKRDHKRVFLGELKVYLSRGELLEQVYAMCDMDTLPAAKEAEIETDDEEDDRNSVPPPVVEKCDICGGLEGNHKMSCPDRPDGGQLKIPVKGVRKRQRVEPGYSKPETLGPDSPMAHFVQQWWEQHRGNPVEPVALRTLASDFGITWPENQWIPPGLRNEFVDINPNLIVQAEVAPDSEGGWLMLTSQHFDKEGFLVE